MFENRWDPPAGAERARGARRTARTCSPRIARSSTSAAATPRSRRASPTTPAARRACSGSRDRAATSRRSTAGGFTGLRLDEILPLAQRDAMTDEEMVAYLARCQLDPSMPRPSIETLLHAFVPHAHVDHTHPDAIGAIVGTVDGERLAAGVLRLRRGLDSVHAARVRALEARRGGGRASIPRRSSSCSRSTASSPGARRPRSPTRRRSTRSTAPRRSSPSARAGVAAFGGRARRAARRGRRTRSCSRASCRRCAAPSRSTARASSRSTRRPTWSSSPAAPSRPQLSQVGAACPDHLVHTRRRPSGSTSTRAEDADALRERVRAARSREWQARESSTSSATATDERLSDPSPRVIVHPGGRPRLGRADAQGGAARARPLSPRDQRHARRRRRSAASSRSTTRSRSRSSTGRSSSTS